MEQRDSNNQKLFRKQTSWSLTTTVWAVIIVLLVVFGALFVLVFEAETSRAERDYEIREAEAIITGVTKNIEAEIENYKDISRLIMIQEDVLNYLRADKVDSGIANDAKYGIMDMLNVCKYMDSVMIFRNDGEYISTGHGVYNIDFERMSNIVWQYDIMSRKGGAVVMINANDVVSRSDSEIVITIARAIYDINSQKKTGFLLMNMSLGMLRNVVGADAHALACVSNKGIYLTGDDNLTEMFSKEFDSDTITHVDINTNGSTMEMLSGKRIGDSPICVLCVTSADSGVVPRDTIIALVLLPIAFLLTAFILGTFLARNVTEPLNDLTVAIEKNHGSGQIEKVNINLPKNEVGQLGASYNRMVDHINELVDQQIENEKNVQKAEMRVLHEQIKPHFLYNSLETISCMALDANAGDVHAALETLGGFYRNFLSKGDREIPLKREISIIQDYLSLQKLRYGEIIEDEYHIEEDTLNCMIPKLILQPLVENCIYHGIRPKGEPGVIKVTSTLEEDGIHLKVYDSGVGMTQQQIDDLLNSSRTEDLQFGLHGFGLKGTLARIRYYCDSDEVVKIRSEEGEFTEVEIIIPQMNQPTRGV